MPTSTMASLEVSPRAGVDDDESNQLCRSCGLVCDYPP
jgi:hypothetical protein